MNRRDTIKWVLAASATMPLLQIQSLTAAEQTSAGATAVGTTAQPYGTDPDLRRSYHPGELWPLTLSQAQRAQATVLCDTIIPADSTSPSASQVGVVDFIDEWISAPYPMQKQDRELILNGLAWLDTESQQRFSHPVLAINTQQLHAICDDICYVPKAKPEFSAGARFFARFRDLTTGGFYTTPVGRHDLRYVGNVPLPQFDGPPLEVLKKVGLA